MVGRHDGPSVRETAYSGPARVDHRLDGEDHSRLELQPRRRTAVMKNLGFLMESAADAMTTEFTYHRVTVRFGVALYGGADIAQMRAGLDGAYAAPHRLVGCLAKALRLDVRHTHVEHAA